MDPTVVALGILLALVAVGICILNDYLEKKAGRYTPKPKSVTDFSSQNSAERRKSVFTIVFDGWRQLTKSRDAIILEFYRKSAENQGIVLDRSLKASEARESYIENQKMTFSPTNIGIDSIESKIVLFSRFAAGWIVLWTSLFPFLVAGFLAFNRLDWAQNQNVKSIVSTFVFAMISFFVSAFLGLFIQAIFVRPYVAFLTNPTIITGTFLG